MRLGTLESTVTLPARTYWAAWCPRRARVNSAGGFMPGDATPLSQAGPLTARVERRESERLRCNQDTDCRLLGRPDDRPLAAWVRDLSATGISLLLPRRFAPGAILAIALENVSQRFLRRYLVRVIHTVEFPNGDWLHGCSFALPLDDDDLRVLRETRFEQRDAG